MSPLEITMFIYSAKQSPASMSTFRCLRCGRVLFRSSSDKIIISNAYGVGLAEQPPGSSYIEHQCHSCKTLYKILFQ